MSKVTTTEGTMLGAYVTEWCAPGTVADKISFGQVPAPAGPKKGEVIIGVKAASVSIDCVSLLQDTAAGGWLYHTRRYRWHKLALCSQTRKSRNNYWLHHYRHQNFRTDLNHTR